jgi:hypothetical protein
MSQTPRFTRARQLTASVLPGRRTDDYATAVSGRLHKIAASQGTGMLPFSGRCDGAIYFRDGKVVYAESERTPGPPVQAAGDLSPLSKIAALLAVAEPTVDAALELLSGESRYLKFRPGKAPDDRFASSIPLGTLLTEVSRRQRVMKQMSGVLTADTAVARNPQLRSESVRVSALQWALVIRVRRDSTPRDLARELSRSVFGTTAEVYRLLALRLLYVAGQQLPTPGEVPRQGLAVMSFVQAVSVKKGGSMPLAHTGTALGDAG